MFWLYCSLIRKPEPDKEFNPFLPDYKSRTTSVYALWGSRANILSSAPHKSRLTRISFHTSSLFGSVSSHLMRLWYFSSSVNSFFKRISGTRCLIFGRTLRLLPYIMCANSEGSGETARMRRLAWAFVGRLCDKYHNLMSWLNYYRNQLHSLFSAFPRNAALRLNLHWQKVVPVHPTFLRLVQKIKFSHQNCLVLYIRENLAQTLRVI